MLTAQNVSYIIKPIRVSEKYQTYILYDISDTLRTIWNLVSTNIDKVLEKRDIDEDDDYAVDEEFDPIINKKFCKWRLCPFLFREF